MSLPMSSLGDRCTGHGNFPPRPSTSGSSNVFINGKPALRVGDSFAPHAPPNVTPHGGSVSVGSSTVSINGRGAARIGDPVSCGSAVAEGSADVSVGG